MNIKFLKAHPSGIPADKEVVVSEKFGNRMVSEGFAFVPGTDEEQMQDELHPDADPAPSPVEEPVAGEGETELSADATLEAIKEPEPDTVTQAIEPAVIEEAEEPKDELATNTENVQEEEPGNKKKKTKKSN